MHFIGAYGLFFTLNYTGAPVVQCAILGERLIFGIFSIASRSLTNLFLKHSAKTFGV